MTADKYSELLEKIDIATYSRYEWQAAYMSSERIEAQKYMVSVARSANHSSVETRCQLYKAAHAILPLREQALVEFVDLLVRIKPTQHAWADALVSVIAELAGKNDRIASAALSALRDCNAAAAIPSDRKRMDLLLQHVSRHVKPLPNWLLPWSARVKGSKP